VDLSKRILSIGSVLVNDKSIFGFESTATEYRNDKNWSKFDENEGKILELKL
jgi:hypothetical protein